MPRFDQSFSGLCEQNLQDTLHLKQRFLDAKAKRVSKAKDKKQEAIQSSVHVQQKFLKRSADDLDTGGPLDSFEPPVKLQCTTQQHGSHQNEGLTKFSVEIVQQLEFTTSAASSQPQQISTNVTVKTHANASVKSDVSSPKASTPGTPGHQQQQKANIGLDVGTLVECVKQEPDNDFADLDQCAAALEKDAAANGGAGFGGFPDLIGDDTNDEIMSSAAFKDLISDISNYSDYPELMKEFDFEDKPSENVNNMKAEDIKDTVPTQPGNDLKHTQSPLLGNQNNFSPPVYEKNPAAAVNARLPYSNMDFTKTELSPAAQTLKQMAEQHQHKNQMGLNFNPANRGPSARSPYSQDFQFQGDYGSSNPNPSSFHKNGSSFPQPDMIKQEMIFQGNDFNDMKRKAAPPTSGMYTKQQQYSPYGSPGQSGSPGYLNSGRGNGPNSGPFGGGTPPRPPSGPGGNQQGPGGTSVQINQAQQLNISQQNHGHIQVSAGQQLHLSADIKGNVSIAAQQGMHFTQQQQQQHNASSAGSQNPTGGANAQHSPMSSSQHQTGPMSGGMGSQNPMSQGNSQQMGGNMNPMNQQMAGAQMGGPQGLSGMQNPTGNMGGQSGMQGGLGGMMGGPNMSHGNVLSGHPDSYSMSQTQTINFTQQTLRRATGPPGMGTPMGGPSAGPMGASTGPLGPRLMSAQTLEQQKLQQMLRAQAMQQQQQQQLRPPPPDYKTSAGLGQGMQPRYGAPAPPPNMRRMPHQPIPPSGPMIRSNVYMLQQQQQQQMAGRSMFNRQPGPMGGMETIQQNNSAEWRQLLMSQQQNANFGAMRPSFQQGGFNMNMGGGSLQQMTALQHQQQQMRAQQASMGGGQGGMGHVIGGQGGPMAQMNSMNQAMLHMQQQQTLMQQQQQQQQNSQMSMSNIHMQQSQSISISGQSMQQQQQPSNGNMLTNTSNNSNSATNALASFNPQTTDFNFEFLDNLSATGDTAAFTDQELLNSFGADAGFPLDF
ncbi:neurogenic protein mastermind isoform X2 [Sitophilus oryzae]|uniref:Neurogenic protein mastermind isoform X2 n=1 Tax=Sitophilus oryzae TaxID=7048 RepID=A0A6J2YL07_SITOR|nr:neurogenic protein mastermind isoform X2 [Sitophilus oryzae]